MNQKYGEGIVYTSGNRGVIWREDRSESIPSVPVVPVKGTAG